MEIAYPITECKSTTRYNDISTVFAYLVEPIEIRDGYIKKCDTFSCFSGHYQVRDERAFIEKLIQESDGKYSSFHIAWTDSN